MFPIFFTYAIVAVPLAILVVKSKSLWARALAFLAFSVCTFLLTSLLVVYTRADANIMQGSPAYFAIEKIVRRMSENDPTLLRDLQDIEQIGDAQARVTMHEMQNPVMGAPEAEIVEDAVRLTGEVAIGKEQKLDERNCPLASRISQLPIRLGGPAATRHHALCARSSRVQPCIYVSHVD